VDKALDQWREATPVESQQATLDHFAETGEIDLGIAGVDQNTADVIIHAFSESFERNALKQAGLTMTTYLDHVDEADEPAIRRLVAQGRWDVLADHAHRIAKARRENGLA
jgi:hypothetical protein